MVLWHINHWRLFNAKYCFYIYTRYIWFVNKVKQFQVLLYITNNLIKHKSFVYIQLNDQTLLFLTIPFIISHFFALNLNVKQFYLTHSRDSIRCYHSRSEWTWERGQWRGTPHFPKLRHYWNLTIRLFNVIVSVFYSYLVSYPGHYLGVWGSYSSTEIQLAYSTVVANWASSE